MEFYMNVKIGNFIQSNFLRPVSRYLKLFLYFPFHVRKVNYEIHRNWNSFILQQYYKVLLSSSRNMYAKCALLCIKLKIFRLLSSDKFWFSWSYFLLCVLTPSFLTVLLLRELIPWGLKIFGSSDSAGIVIL